MAARVTLVMKGDEDQPIGVVTEIDRPGPRTAGAGARQGRSIPVAPPVRRSRRSATATALSDVSAIRTGSTYAQAAPQLWDGAAGTSGRDEHPTSARSA